MLSLPTIFEWRKPPQIGQSTVHLAADSFFPWQFFWVWLF